MIGIYARVSTEEQAKKGFSLQDQIAACQKKAGTNEVRKYVDEGISGEFLDRPALSRLREDAKKGLIRKVICLDPDRLSRKLMNQLIITEELDRRGVELVFVNGEYAKTPEGTLFYSMRGAISEFEKAKINERMSRGRKEKARQGRVLRDFQVYGYDYDKKMEKFIINEEEAKVVRLIFELFTRPNQIAKGINGIARYLTSMGIPTKRGAKVWHRQVVRQILMNRAYKGEFYQNRWNTEGMLGNKYRLPEERVSISERPKNEWILIPCPQIIDDNTFCYAQQLLEESRRRWAKKSKHQYLLSGLIRCGDCKNTMTGRKVKHWQKYTFQYTDVKNYTGAKYTGCGRSIACKELDHHVWEQIANWLNQPDKIVLETETLFRNQPDILSPQSEMFRLEKEIEKTRIARKKLLKLFAEGKEVVEDEILQEINEWKEKEKQLKEQWRKMLEKQKVKEEAPFTLELMREAADYFLDRRQERLTFEDKKALIRQVAKEIIVYDDRVEIYTF